MKRGRHTRSGTSASCGMPERLRCEGQGARRYVGKHRSSQRHEPTRAEDDQVSRAELRSHFRITIRPRPRPRPAEPARPPATGPKPTEPVWSALGGLRRRGLPRLRRLRRVDLRRLIGALETELARAGEWGHLHGCRDRAGFASRRCARRHPQRGLRHQASDSVPCSGERRKSGRQRRTCRDGDTPHPAHPNIAASRSG
jgi:hypothetical protein